ncbi:Longevity assurance, LAG1/LAC1 [Metarhizium album ARSEF 1941]|uniref:Longevity assurance, LAG1/LAC1 n=1 Tax=Metarhizium album (strain ARSEF 1941) TaxID=1081103 RepID=A0A0B2X5Z3_METAS|nr:Longevity assurance, LAG1/LAC1 [Metarhizium album ARSEF 1941]KHO00721.1 Longevity assurance, LAG1/LAC1 [Metarhizium album ARSEF 1941]
MSEPFPLLSSPAEQLHSLEAEGTRRRRKSSGLGSEICVGDTGAPAFASSTAGLDHGRRSERESTHGAAPASASSSSSPSSSWPLNGTTTAATKRGLSKRRRARGLLSRVRQTCAKHTWVLPLAVLCLVLSGYAVNPSNANPLHHLIFLSYPLPHARGGDGDGDGDSSRPTHYGKGPWDVALVAFYTVVLSFTREFVMQELLRPWARAAGLKRNKQARFMEQAYTALYFFFLGPAGMLVMSRTPVRYFNTHAMYADYPHRSHEAAVKFYYLFQAAYWAQQAIVLVLGMEKPRKDFKELVGHHVVSLALIALSYRFHFTYVGIAVYTTHDISDFFLATSKVLNYLDHPLVAPYFFLFVCVWIYLRHVVNLRILWSLMTEFRTVGPFELDWATEQYKCWISQYISVALLASLQALNLFWLFYIIRIAYRFIRDSTADDERSDDDDDDDDEPAHLDEEPLPTLELNGKPVNGSLH